MTLTISPALAGVFAPLPTPFDEHDQLDLRRLRESLTRWLASPLQGFVLLGTNGEAALLADDESERVITVARQVVPSDRPLIVGTGRESTGAAIRAAKRAADLGADAVLVRTPGFFKAQMTPDALVRHYTDVADASPVPLLLYNFTAMTGVNLAPSSVGRLAQHPNIVGIKESGADIAQLTELVTATPPGFTVLAGSSATFYSALAIGARGGILALAGVLPDACVKLFNLVQAGDHQGALALQQQLLPISRLLGAVHGVAGLKAALHLVGCDMGFPRRPLAPLPEAAMAALQSALSLFQDTQYEPAT